ncbi:ABC transporter substrate-binding protein [Pimelobacter simplex]|uniref:ABC transporter substrate-binding protein n=1 Tax=Nocardioides simplex TaxID=2045 RepID=UPI00215001A7|nr:ABC transporter substrate-binding protein [Pimelobacter simplex]UUW88962.1 ABC transporter substrate-binding protein [Pimelobacter simplex]UUW98467.1 ABC transporter substrate-binding protein [Pimelobacter simplex]
MRSPLSLAVAGALALALTACSSDVKGDNDAEPASGASATPEGPWSFTDGSGEKVELDEVPTRIIAHSAEAAALMAYGIRPVGIYGDESVKTDPNLQGLDLSGIEILGEEWGSIDVAKASTLSPDLIVADWWPAEKAHSGMEEGVKAKSKKIAELAPVVGISQGDSILDLAEGYEDLAESLGADVENSQGAKDKAAFEKARDTFVAAMDEKDFTALAVSPASDLLYVANPEYAPELLDFDRWGLDIIEPDSPDKGFPYWENLSWENADKYQPDVLMFDNRSMAADRKTVQSQPTWNSIRAAKADQIVEWPGFWLHTYGHYATALTKLTEQLSGLDDSIGD